MALLVRWRGALIAVAIIALGLFWGLGSGGIVALFGWALVALGAILIWSAAQRRRFSAPVDDPGVVEILEGQVSYFGPAGGGFAALSDLGEILIATRGGQRAWVLRTPGVPDLVIPVGAAGADQLFDAFGSLPRLTGSALVAALAAPPGRGDIVVPMIRRATPDLRLVWRRPPTALR